TAGGLSVVGFYRSHTRDGLYMDEADLSVAQHYFPDAGNVFLLIKPFASRTSIGGFFFWENGEINRQSSYLQFPFHREEWGGGEPHLHPRPSASVTHRLDGNRPLPPYTPASEPRRKAPEPAPQEELFSLAGRSNLSILSAPPAEPPPRTYGLRMLPWLL